MKYVAIIKFANGYAYITSATTFEKLQKRIEVGIEDHAKEGAVVAIRLKER